MVVAVSPWVVGQRLKAVALNTLVSAIKEIQSELLRTRAQVKVYSPPTVTTSGASNIPYAYVRKDSHSGWSATTHAYTVPTNESGLYSFSIAGKHTSAAAGLELSLMVNGSPFDTSATSATSATSGVCLSGTVDLVTGDTVAVRCSASFIPNNTAVFGEGCGSNYFHLTRIGSS